MPTTKNTNAWKLFCNEFNTTGDNPEIKLHPTPQDHRTTKAIIRHYYHLRSPWAMRANGKCVHTIGGEVIPFVGHHKFQGKINHKWRCNCWKCFKLVTNLKPFFVCNAPHTKYQTKKMIQSYQLNLYRKKPAQTMQNSYFIPLHL